MVETDIVGTTFCCVVVATGGMLNPKLLARKLSWSATPEIVFEELCP
jgi:hypothetical protein